MRCALVVVLCASMVFGCDSPGPATSQTQSSSGDERLAHARREMGLSDLAGESEDEDDDDLPFEVGPQHFPELPNGVNPDGADLRDALVSATATFAMARPSADSATDVARFQAWVEEDYARWISERGRSLRASRDAFRDAEQGELGEYVVASAIIAMLFFDFARAIATIPLPPAIEQDPGERLRFRDAFLRAASPLYDRARDTFGACASATVRSPDSSLTRWQRFCDARLEQAQDAPRPIE